MSFKEYIRWRCLDEQKLQEDFVCDDSGLCIVDFVGRFEQLDADFRRIVANLGIKTERPHRNSSKRSKVLDYYDDETQKLVADTFDQDFQFLTIQKS